MTALLLAAVLAQPQPPAGAYEGAGPWEAVEQVGALAVSRRKVKDSDLFEYRVEADTDVPVTTACDAIFEWGTRGTDFPGITARRVLKDGDDYRVVYDSLSQPIVSDREYVMAVVRTRGEDGVCRIRFFNTRELAPKPPKGVVRLDKLWGSWTLEPAGERTRLTYTLYSDPGGSLPHFLAHGSMRKNCRAAVAMALEKARGMAQARRR